MTAVTKTRTWPKRCESHPASKTEIAFATAYDVITQVAWLAPTPRSPAMCGSATFAIVVSNTSMKVPSASAMVTRANARPLKHVS